MWIGEVPSGVEIADPATVTNIGCAATGVELGANDQSRGNGIAEVLTFTEGRWQDRSYLQPTQPCQADNPDSDISASSRSLIPQTDGSLQGVESTTITTDQCGNQGTVYRITITTTRVGDVPAGVTIGDPVEFLPGS